MDLKNLITLLKTEMNIEVNNDFIEKHKNFLSDIIDYLIYLIDDKSDNKEIRRTLLHNVASINPNLNVSDLEKRIQWLKEFKVEATKVGLKNSHSMILNVFDEINRIFYYKSIDYYHTSGLLVYLLTNTPLVRYHHDLDIFINEKSLLNLKSLLEKTNFNVIQYTVHRDEYYDRIVTKIVHNKYDIPISVFSFTRNDDGSVYVNEYCYDKSGKLYAFQEYNSKTCVDLSFSNHFKFYNDIPYKTITLEALYNCKKGNRPKDVYDCKIILPYVDMEIENIIDKEIKSSMEFNKIKKLDKKLEIN